jgi:flagellar protein FlaJ
MSMALTRYQQISYKWFGRFGEKRASDHLQENLHSAHMEIRAGAYLSYVLLSTILIILVTFCFFTSLLFLIFPALHVQLPLGLTVLFLLLPLLIGVLAYVIMLWLPGSRAKSRGKKIDANLAYAVNFISAMASAGVTPTEIFKSLSRQDIYSEIKNEAAWVYRDVGLLGFDIITAIKAGIQRTPSVKFKEFLQGMVVTVTSGGSLKTYFMHKADQYMWENRTAQKQLIETLGIMAESYVTAAVAGMLMLLIVIPLMMMISNNYNGPFLLLLVFFVLPIVHFGFAGVIRLMFQGG